MGHFSSRENRQKQFEPISAVSSLRKGHHAGCWSHGHRKREHLLNQKPKGGPWEGVNSHVADLLALNLDSD